MDYRRCQVGGPRFLEPESRALGLSPIPHGCTGLIRHLANRWTLTHFRSRAIRVALRSRVGGVGESVLMESPGLEPDERVRFTTSRALPIQWSQYTQDPPERKRPAVAGRRARL